MRRYIPIFGLLLLAGIAPYLAGCTNTGDLKPDARAKLEDASKWAHRGSATAHAVIVTISATCSANPSKFCDKAMPIVTLADGALTLFDKALASGDAALADTGSTDQKLSNALAALLSTEKDVEDYIAKLKVQQAQSDWELIQPPVI